MPDPLQPCTARNCVLAMQQALLSDDQSPCMTRRARLRKACSSKRHGQAYTEVNVRMRLTCRTIIWKVRIRITLSTSSHIFLLGTLGAFSIVVVLIGVRSNLQGHSCHEWQNFDREGKTGLVTQTAPAPSA